MAALMYGVNSVVPTPAVPVDRAPVQEGLREAQLAEGALA